ncbi:D-2-hydroxyacid dehydrogenase [Haloglomus litoreum]|uniref:D-2-hydroxyacid dehydrogenase n=1 Tax=Haloglomus litoreum TaxID=3034026 RepID=UPI0023E7A706|nr:D-2-hydroxyacid dehydrogenase [Haloglomus sp. DT116]
MPAELSEVAVLHHKPHGLSPTTYVDALHERLPDVEVTLASTPAERRDAVADAPVVTSNDLDPDLLDAADALDLFACTYAGVDHLPLETLRERGVAVTNASGVHGPNVAEHVLGWLLTMVRRLDEGWRRQGRREWSHFQAAGELQGATVTVVGLGAIGEAVVERLAGFGVETVGARYTPAKGGPTDEVVGYDDLPEVLPRTDHLVLACPLTDETRELVDATALELLPPDATLVNVARGPVVDTEALVETLRRNRLHAAALDVTDPEPLPEDHPLWTLENVLLTPHNAGHTPHYFERCADILAENVRRVNETGSFEDLQNQV